MERNSETGLELRPKSALTSARAVSLALSDLARLAKISRHSRRALTGGGVRARQGARLLRFAAYTSFFLVVVAPSAAAAVYFFFVASDQYVAEAKFMLMGGTPPTTDSFGSFTGIPAIAIIQDTQIVTDFIHSRAVVDQLEQKIGVRGLYATNKADWWARFEPSKSVEKFLRYWNSMVSVSISMPSGVVDLRVRAFSPKDAQTIASAILESSEALINDLNARMNHEAVANAETELDRTTARLTKASLALEAARNDAGLLDAGKAADAMNALLTDTRGGLLELQAQYASQLNYASPTAPQMLALKSKIDSTSAQIADLESKITKTNLTLTGATLAKSMTQFDELDLERKIAQNLYAGAASSLEIARLVAENKYMYLNPFVTPVAPEDAEYPKRGLFSAGIFAGLLALWGAGCGLAIAIRNYAA
jgi:capsular polysaccharide transport system permease protein